MNNERVIESAVLPLVDRAFPVGQRYVGVWAGVVTPHGEFGRGFGETRIGNGEIPTARTFFEIGSISKTLTGILLAQRGLDVTLEAQEFLPSSVTLPRFGKVPIRLIDLLTHTSALPSIASSVRSLEMFLNFSCAEAYEFLNGLTLTRSPGCSYEYSNFGFGLLAHLLDGGQPAEQTHRYEQLIHEITGPLGLEETVVFLNEEQRSRAAEGHDHHGQPGANWNWGRDSWHAGAGALRSTGKDMLKFLAANLGLRSTALQTALQTSHQALFARGEGQALGYGWKLRQQAPDRVVWHNGGTSGFQSFLGFIPEKQTGVVLLANTAHETENQGVDPRIDQAGFAILQSSTS